MIEIDKTVDGQIVDMCVCGREEALKLALTVGIKQLLDRPNIDGGRYFFRLSWMSEEEIVAEKSKQQICCEGGCGKELDMQGWCGEPCLPF